MIANTFACHISTVAKIIKDVCCAIPCKLGPKYVHVPQTNDAMVEKASEFEAKYGIHQTFGCIDGTHVAIITPVDPWLNFHRIVFVTNTFSVSMFKQFVAFLVSFMDVGCRLLGMFKMQRFFKIHQFRKN